MENWSKDVQGLAKRLFEAEVGTFCLAVNTKMEPIEPLWITRVLKEHGFHFTPERVVKIKMEEGACHENCESLANSDKWKYDYAMCTGYTLNGGVWRRHSWMVSKDEKTILETTISREAYFGLDMGSLFNYLVGYYLEELKGVNSFEKENADLINQVYKNRKEIEIKRSEAIEREKRRYIKAMERERRRLMSMGRVRRRLMSIERERLN